MKYIVNTDKPITQVIAELETIVTKYGFGVLHIHDLKQTIKNKGVEFENECKVLEICNPKKAKYFLTQDMSLNMALPCRISVYEDGGQNKIGTILPTSLLGALSNSKDLQEVEAISISIIDEVK